MQTPGKHRQGIKSNPNFPFFFKQTFTIGALKSSGSNMSDLEQILSEPLTFLEGKQNFNNSQLITIKMGNDAGIKDEIHKPIQTFGLISLHQ